ncbi:Fc.00g108590.m01.CDS01 [Cosmosporella sp. VM-42]
MGKQEGTSLESTLASLLARREARSQLRRLTTAPKSSVDFSSNSYLSLSSHPEVQRAFLQLLQSHIGSSSPSSTILGSGGSRLLDGNTPFAEVLERDIAAFHRAPAGLLFNSGFDANVGLFSCVPQPGDTIIYDELIHASVHDGMRLSRAKQRLPFQHNTVETPDGPVGESAKGLDQLLQDLIEGESGKDIREGRKSVFVAVEGVYSMDGDVAPLQAIVTCVETRLPKGNGYIIVDEAHSTGLFGKQGRGLVCELGLEDSVFARVHTFGKAMSCSGATVLASQTVRSYLINYARSLIYTTAMPFSSLASIKATYDFIANGQAEPLVRNLNELMKHTHSLFTSLCSRHQPSDDLLSLDPSPPKSPIIPILTSHPRSLAQHCQQNGYMVRPIVAPTVPVGSERVRICLHAGNTREQVEGLAKAVEEWLLIWMSPDTDPDTIGSQAQLSNGVGQESTERAKL